VAAALAQWEAEHPDEDPEGGFPDRFLQVETTLGGAGVIRGDLTPECAAAVTAVLEALGAPRGALLYRPLSGQRLEEVSLGLMANS